jgi:hypothetical protein
MNINPINSINTYTPASSKINSSSNKNTDKSLEKDAVVYEKSGSENNISPSETIAKLKQETATKTKALRDIVEKLINKQANTVNKLLNPVTKKDWEYIISNYEIDQTTISEAKEAISENGYFGVKKTTERIMDFAKALSGGDPANIDALRDAVEKGFKKAEQAWGGELPSICGETYQAVMDEFTKWKAEASQS